MILDSDKKGLSAIFKDWQVPLLEALFERPLTSREAHMFLAERSIKAHPDSARTISRALIIGFFNKLTEKDLLTYTAFSGKGGVGRRYEMVSTREEFAHKIIGLFVNKLITAFPKDFETFPWLEL